MEKITKEELLKRFELTEEDLMNVSGGASLETCSNRAAYVDCMMKTCNGTGTLFDFCSQVCLARHCTNT